MHTFIHMKQTLSLILLLIAATATTALANDSYAKREVKAERHFKYKEWSSALAMYMLMLDQQPDKVEPYYKAIVAGAMIGDSITQIDMLQRTQKRGIPLDSLFSGVRSVSFSIGESNAYKNFLLLVKNHQPWLKRRINIYLLNYYDFCNDYHNAIAIGEQLLAQTPTNTDYMKVIAQAYTDMSDFDNAMAYYRRILTVKRNDYDALLALGNYYAMLLLYPADTSTCSNALSRDDLAALSQTYLSEAYNIYPTPYVAQLIDKVRKILFNNRKVYN